MLQPPGFRLEDVTLAVTLWHGEQDSLIPISHSLELARRYPPRRSSLSQTSGTFTTQRPSSRSPLSWCASPRSRRQLTALRLTELSLADEPARDWAVRDYKRHLKAVQRWRLAGDCRLRDSVTNALGCRPTADTDTGTATHVPECGVAARVEWRARR